nr:hypothetical protein [uncultured Rhodopila sp.]
MSALDNYQAATAKADAADSKADTNHQGGNAHDVFRAEEDIDPARDHRKRTGYDDRQILHWCAFVI